MKNLILSLTLITTCYSYSQEHFSGISTSKRGGLLNANNNPAELVNMNSKYEVNLFNFSLGMANNKLTFGDLINGDNLEDKIFEGDEAVNLRLDAQILGPSFAFKYKKWGFGISNRYNSYMRNIDKVFEDAIAGNTFILPGLKEYRQVYNKGNITFDARISYQCTDKLKASFIANNVFNTETTSRPGDIQAPRNFLVQLAMKF